MAASRAKLLTHRKKKKLSEPSSIKLIQPMAALSVDEQQEKIVHKVRVPTRKSALVGIAKMATCSTPSSGGGVRHEYTLTGDRLYVKSNKMYFLAVYWLACGLRKFSL